MKSGFGGKESGALSPLITTATKAAAAGLVITRITGKTSDPRGAARLPFFVSCFCVTLRHIEFVEHNTSGETSDAISPSVTAPQASLADTSKTQKLEKKFLAHLTRMGGNRNHHHFQYRELNEKIEFAKEQYTLAIQAIQSERHGSEAAAVAHLREAILRIKGESLSQIADSLRNGIK